MNSVEFIALLESRKMSSFDCPYAVFLVLLAIATPLMALYLGWPYGPSFVVAFVLATVAAIAFTAAQMHVTDHNEPIESLQRIVRMQTAMNARRGAGTTWSEIPNRTGCVMEIVHENR